MTQFEIYTIILCIIVFIMLVSVFSFLVVTIVKLWFKNIKAGLEDENIIKEFTEELNKPKNKIIEIFGLVFNVFLCALFCGIFVMSLYINNTQDTYFDDVPTYRVVLTSSMENKNQNNKYLFDNNLNDQLSAFDLITTYKVPKEEDLKLYDIVVYEVDGVLVVHRIVGIEEPNESHPNERYFLLQGDNVESPDRFPVRYSQMKAIYKGEKIPFVGSFVLFMQSPAGWLCMLLVVFAMVATPLLERKFGKEKALRLQAIIDNQTELEIASAEIVENQNQPIENIEQVSEADRSLPDFASFNKIKTLSFHEKLEIVPELVKQRYNNLSEKLDNFKGVRCIHGKGGKTYKKGNKPIVRFAIKGKTLNAFVALNPEKYKDSKYIFTDVSSVKKLKNYPMRVKVTSDRQERYLVELVNKVLQEEKGE